MGQGLNKIYSSKQEHSIADNLEWSVVSGSGSRFQPGDVRSESWLGECKTHTKSDHKVEFKLDVWEKIYSEAVSQLRRPAYFSDDGSQTLRNTWVMTTWLPCDDAVTVSYPSNVKKIFTFASSEAWNDLLNLGGDASIKVFEFKFGKDTVWLTRFDIFKDIVERI